MFFKAAGTDAQNVKILFLGVAEPNYFTEYQISNEVLCD
jgi:hypothetical protein